jgi:hypothetical protein
MLSVRRRCENNPSSEQTHKYAHPFSLTLLNKLAAGIRAYALVRSDMQQIRADAPNPDSRFKEHCLSNPKELKINTTKLA